MPDVLPGDVKLGLESGDLAWVSDERVFEAGFPRVGRYWVVRQLSRCQRHSIRVRRQRLPVYYLEHHLMKMNRMGVLGEVVHFPEFGFVQTRRLGGRFFRSKGDICKSAPRLRGGYGGVHLSVRKFRANGLETPP